MEQITLTKDKLFMTARFSQQLISDIEVSKSHDFSDYMHGTFTATLEATLAKMAEEKERITLYQPPQKFWDWIRRKKQAFTFEINRKEVMKNPPKFSDQAVMLYGVKRIEDEN